MISEYKNILANRFMRDTNYIIIKDTDDLDELERQWELFQSSLTVRQQRLSDDRSLQIWNMTNQQHYEYQKAELMQELQDRLGINGVPDEEDNSIEYDPEQDGLNGLDDDNEIQNLINTPLDDFEIPDDDNEINEPIKEDSIIPISNEKPITSYTGIIHDREKDAQADQYEIDSNINIIGSIAGHTPKEKLDNLEKDYIAWNSQNQDHRKKSDDKCREIYGMSNIDRYNKLKGIYTSRLAPENPENAKPNISNNTNDSEEALGEFVSEVYKNMQAINEAESEANKQHRRFNDTPYFTPSEMIDMGVSDNGNWYCPVADNDGLINGIRTPQWFDNYKNMCMDHIFEDYTKEWIATLEMLYSDFDQIKESGDNQKILARKQSILDLGWNPNIPFTRKNRQLAAKRVNKLLDKSSPLNIFIKLDKEVSDQEVVDTPVTENAAKDTHQPVFIVFVQGGKGKIVPRTISAFTNSDYTHVGISFDSSLKDVHTYNMVPKPGIVRETLSRYDNNIITVMTFFAPTAIFNAMKDNVMDYYVNTRNTVYDLTAIMGKAFKKNTRVIDDKYHQICSTFVDNILKSGQIDLSKDNGLPDPGQLYTATKSMPNKIIEVYSGPADKYNSDKVDKKLNKLIEKGTKAIDESTTITEGIHDILNGTNPYSTKIFYHISFDDNLDDEVLKPRIPSWITNEVKKNPNFIKELEKLKDSNSTSGTGFEEYMTPRVCFSPSIEGCLNAIINEKGRMHLHNETLYVYIPEKPIKEYKTKTNRQILKDGDIFDANVTQEMWILEPVKLKYVGSIVVDKITGEHIRKFANNKNKTNIKYDYKWHWFHKVKYRYNEEKNKFVTESVLNEVKQFPVEFDQEGNLIIYKARIGSIAYGDEIDDSVKLLESYRNTNNIEGMKYELAKLWFINDSIEKKLKRPMSNEQYKELINQRAICLNVFKLNLEYVMKAEKGFNFSDYYNSTPFSDNSIKISANTLKYSLKAIASLL